MEEGWVEEGLREVVVKEVVELQVGEKVEGAIPEVEDLEARRRWSWWRH